MVDVDHQRAHRSTNPLTPSAHQLRSMSKVPTTSCYLEGARARHPATPKESFDHAKMAVEASWHEVSLSLLLAFFLYSHPPIAPTLSPSLPSLA